MGEHHPAGQPRVICLVSLPPPTTGRTLATRRFLDELSRSMDLDIHDLAPSRSVGLAFRLCKSWRSLRSIARLAARPGRPGTAMYLVANHGAGLIYDILFGVIARMRGYPMLIHHHAFSYLDRRRRLMALLVRLAPRDTVHLVLCRRMRDRFIQIYRPAGAVHVTPNFSEHAGSEQQISDAHEHRAPITLGFLSNITREKGVDEIIALARHLCPSEDFRFLVAGPARDPDIQRNLERMATTLPNSFEWLGPVYDEQKQRFFASVDVFLFPTRYANEAQPLVILEALAAGCVVVTNARGCIGELINEDCGLLIVDPDEFVARTIEWLKPIQADRSRLDAMSRAALMHSKHLNEAATKAVNTLAQAISEHRI